MKSSVFVVSMTNTRDVTIGVSVGSACPPAKQQRKSQPTSQSPEDLAGSRLLTAQDVPTIVQVVLDVLPSQTGALGPMQSSDAEVAPSPGTSGDDVPSNIIANSITLLLSTYVYRAH